MSRSKRVLFSFDERNLELMDRMVEAGSYASRSEAARETVKVVKALQDQFAQGFTEVVVRNPRTGAERVLMLNLGMPAYSTPAAEMEATG